MSEPSKRHAPIRAVAFSIAVVLTLVCIATFILPDVSVKFGWAGVAAPTLAQSDHSGHDHDAHQDHDHSGHDHDAHQDHDHSGHDHGAHQDHDHLGHSEANSVELSQQARTNIKLRTQPVSVAAYTQYIEVPGVITNWPGRTHVAVNSPLTGVLQSILVSRGELVTSGTPLFMLRLTHQDLVDTQEMFLRKLGELDVEQREIDRLSSLVNSGAIAGKTLLTRKYERDKLLAGVRVARQSMLLHGLSEEQIARIERTRELIREVTVCAPTLHKDRSLHHDSLGTAYGAARGYPGRSIGIVDSVADAGRASGAH